MCCDSGWVPVDRSTMETKFHGVFAIGDVTRIMLSSIGKRSPKAGVFAHNGAEAVAHNIALAMPRKRVERRFTGAGECFIDTGDRRAAFGSGNFYAEPASDVQLKEPSVMLHVAKVAYEQYWLLQWF